MRRRTRPSWDRTNYSRGLDSERSGDVLLGPVARPPSVIDYDTERRHPVTDDLQVTDYGLRVHDAGMVARDHQHDVLGIFQRVARGPRPVARQIEDEARNSALSRCIRALRP